MQTYFVRVECDVTAKVHAQPLRYRAYVNNELFAERTWTWTNQYLEEMLQIEAEPGEYTITYQLVNTATATLHINNMRVDHGAGQIKDNMLRITK